MNYFRRIESFSDSSLFMNQMSIITKLLTAWTQPWSMTKNNSDLEEILTDKYATQKSLSHLISAYGEKAKSIAGYRSLYQSQANIIMGKMLQELLLNEKRQPSWAKRKCYMDMEFHVPRIMANSSKDARMKALSLYSDKNSSSSCDSTMQPYHYDSFRDPTSWKQFDGSLNVKCKRSNNPPKFSLFHLSLDPGYLNFYTAVSNHGDVFELGGSVFPKLKKIQSNIILAQSRLAKIENQENQRSGKPSARLKGIRYQIRSLHLSKEKLVEKLHQDCLSFFSCCDIIFIPPPLDWEDHVGGKNTLTLKVATMKTINHIGFFNSLSSRMKKLGNHMIEVSEKFTTICCSSCGKFQHDVGTQKTFNCSTCQISLGRDENAAWNIYLFTLMRMLRFWDVSDLTSPALGRGLTALQRFPNPNHCLATLNPKTIHS